MLVEERNCRH